MYIISLSNISVKTNNKRRIKINKSQEDLIFIHQCHVTVRSVSLYSIPTTLFLRNVDSTVAVNICTMSLEIMRI
jgi:hypothetical protein